MNEITLKGVLKNIQYSHTTHNIDYDKADILVKRKTNKEDLLSLKFKKFSNSYKEGDVVELTGNIRTYSYKDAQKSKVEVYVFTYFDKPEIDTSVDNIVNIDGRICKSNYLRKTRAGKDVLDFILANNLTLENQALNCYIPCVAWGNLAKELDELSIGTKIRITGQLQSREYKKKISQEDFELRLAYEVNIDDYEILDKN